MIDEWKNTGSRVVTLAAQNLLVDPSCDIRSLALCNDDVVRGDGGPGVDVIPVVIGGIVATLVLVCITVVALAVVIAIVRKRSSTM